MFIAFPLSFSLSTKRKTNLRIDDKVSSTTVANERSRTVYGRRWRRIWMHSRRSGFRLNASEQAVARSTVALSDPKVRSCEDANYCELAKRETTAAAIWSRALLCASFVVRGNRSAEVCPRCYIKGEPLKVERLINLSSFSGRILMGETRAWAQGRQLIRDLNTACSRR